jgi:hypothetical protein
MENVEVSALIGADEKTKLFARAEDVVHGDLLGGHWRDKHEANLTNQFAFVRFEGTEKNIPQAELGIGCKHRQNRDEVGGNDAE